MSMIPPPIETEGSPVSTAADDASEPLPASMSDGGVIVIHAVMRHAGQNQYLVNLSIDGSGDNRVSLLTLGSGDLRMFVRAGGATIVNLTTIATIADGEAFKVAFRFRDGDFTATVDGGTVVSDTSSGFPTGINTHEIGQATAFSGQVWNSTIALDYLDPDPSAWTDADLQDATS